MTEGDTERMAKLERLSGRLAKLLSSVVQEVLEMVKETVSEYQDKNARTQRENASLKRRLLELQEQIPAESAHITADVPVCGPFPEDTKTPEQVSGLPPQQNSGVTPAEQTRTSGHDADHDLRLKPKVEETDVESPAEDTSMQTFSDHCKERSPERRPIDEAAMANRASPGVTDDKAAVSSENVNDSLSASTTLGIQMVVVKKEPDATDCDGPQPPPQQSPGTDLVNASSHFSCLSSAGSQQAQVSSECHRLALIRPHYMVSKRHAFAKTNRMAFSGKRMRMEHLHTQNTHFCTTCGQTFDSVGNLNTHLQCHTRERPHSCVQCGKRFRHRGDLNKHKRVHTGEKPYDCSHCGKSFSRRGNLNRHQKIHIGETAQQTGGYFGRNKCPLV